MQWFVLIEDWEGDGTLGRKCDKDGVPLDPLSAGVPLQSGSDGRPAGAREGYYGLWHKDGNKWRFLQSTCPDTSCDVGDSFISAGDAEGYENEAFTHTITWNALLSNPTLSGELPDGLVYDSSTGVISGIPTETGTFTITVAGVSEDEECNIRRAFNIVILPCRAVDAYIDPDNPPQLTVDEAYSHIVLFDDVTITDWGGFPPGITFDPITGVISGTCEEEGSWTVWIEGTTSPNGCTLRVEFQLIVRPCDPEDSRLSTTGLGIGVGGWEIVYDEPVFYQVTGHRITGDIELYSVEQCCPDPPPCSPTPASLPTGLNYDPTTGILSGVPSDATQCQLAPCYYLLTFRGKSETNDCDVWLQVPLFYYCLCPPPCSYDSLGVTLTLDLSPTVSCETTRTFSIFDEENLVLTNAVWTATIGAQAFNVSGIGTGSLTVSGDGSVPTGTYVVVFFGRVTSGPYENCQIRHTRTYIVS